MKRQDEDNLVEKIVETVSLYFRYEPAGKKYVVDDRVYDKIRTLLQSWQPAGTLAEDLQFLETLKGMCGIRPLTKAGKNHLENIKQKLQSKLITGGNMPNTKRWWKGKTGKSHFYPTSHSFSLCGLADKRDKHSKFTEKPENACRRCMLILQSKQSKK